MIDGQFELEGFAFGAEQTWRVAEWDPGERTLAVGDVWPLARDGVLFGRDIESAPEWIYRLRARHVDVMAALADLRSAWEGRRADPLDTSVLRYMLAGRVRRVYGRPRRFHPLMTPWARPNRILEVDTTFRLSDPLHYDDGERSVTLRIVPPSTGGLLAPLVAPLSTARSSAPDARFITVRGDAPAPVRVTFHGPATDPWVRGTGWEVGLNGSIAYDGQVTVDTRTTTVLRADGASVAGMLTRRTRLAEVRLAPGVHELSFGGIDPTGTASATVAWRDAHYSL